MTPSALMDDHPARKTRGGIKGKWYLRPLIPPLVFPADREASNGMTEAKGIRQPDRKRTV